MRTFLSGMAGSSAGESRSGVCPVNVDLLDLSGEASLFLFDGLLLGGRVFTLSRCLEKRVPSALVWNRPVVTFI